MSFGAMYGWERSLKDDLESFIYVVLYAALRWLPVKSRPGLDWWMAEFFGAPGHDGTSGGADRKLANAIRRSSTSTLGITENSHVLDWLNAVMDLHYKDGQPNPLWNDGEALREMWERFLTKDLPTNDRRVNPVVGMKIRDAVSLQATYTVVTFSTDVYKSHDEPTQPPVPAPPKRPRARSEDDSVPYPITQPSKRSRTEPQTQSTLETDRTELQGYGHLMTGVESVTISGATSTLSSEGIMSVKRL